MLAGKILKADTRNAFLIVKMLMVIYAILNIGNYCIACFFSATIYSLPIRVTGPYNFAFFLMIVPNTLLPLLLFFKKLGSNKYILLTLSFLMNIGWLFELVTFYITNMGRDYIPTQSPFNWLWFLLLQGFLIGAIIYAIGRAIKRKIPNADTPAQ
jgi:hypothetical protein